MTRSILLLFLMAFLYGACADSQGNSREKGQESIRADANREGIEGESSFGSECCITPRETESKDVFIREHPTEQEGTPDEKRKYCDNLRKTWKETVKKYAKCQKDSDCILMGYDINGGDCGGCFFSISLTGESVNKQGKAELQALIDVFNKTCKEYPLCGTDLYISESPRCSSKGLCIDNTRTCFDLRD
ncbi:MAG: hypothetical protein CL920_24990 [Deltaproteobacteria bacterium]|nr:hypothetical protein [Deltaproteobacteria bacterium]MBU49797.1 hypothetical protein [Deltaproteobacteria bacterium]MBU51961.1 hypothetical protein [Deltaproteobacteria bacterium]|tara:strand:+ start:943 stop:1509 length:567 start_codon:yes stop_codon:yes gene_type:complete